MDKHAIRQKQRARKLALQAMYQWLMSAHDIREIELQFHSANNMDKIDVDYFAQLIHQIPKHLETLESAFIPFLDRPIETLNPVELTVLRLGTYELMYCPEMPYRIVLDEWVTLAKEFGSIEGHRYVNGVLNNLGQQIRAIEIKGS